MYTIEGKEGKREASAPFLFPRALRLSRSRMRKRRPEGGEGIFFVFSSCDDLRDALLELPLSRSVWYENGGQTFFQRTLYGQPR